MTPLGAAGTGRRQGRRKETAGTEAGYRGVQAQRQATEECRHRGRLQRHGGLVPALADERGTGMPTILGPYSDRPYLDLAPALLSPLGSSQSPGHGSWTCNYLDLAPALANEVDERPHHLPLHRPRLPARALDGQLAAYEDCEGQLRSACCIRGRAMARVQVRTRGGGARATSQRTCARGGRKGDGR